MTSLLKNSRNFRHIISSRARNKIHIFNPHALKQRTLTLENKFDFFRDCIIEYELKLSNGLSFYPLKLSQFIVDYENSKLYYFNVLYEGKYSQFEFEIVGNKFESSKILIANKLDDEFLQKAIPNAPLTNLGLCLGDKKVFWVYGRYSSESIAKESEQIFYFDTVKNTWVQPKIKRGNGFAPRHSVACSYLYLPNNGDKSHVLYVFGGASSSVFDKSNYYLSFAEIYYLDFENNVFECLQLNSTNQQWGYLPYSHSFCMKLREELLVLGGTKFEVSAEETKGPKAFDYE